MNINLVIITSALAPIVGVIPINDRLQQTITSIETVRDLVPNSFIILSDTSVENIDEQRRVLNPLVDLFIENNDLVLLMSKHGLKSHGELLIMHDTLRYIKTNFDLTNIKRIFKLSGRHNLTSKFNFDDHCGTTYTFKNSVDSWIQPGVLRLFETRLWSMSPTLIDDYLLHAQSMLDDLDGKFDLEHVYYKYFRYKANECDMIGVEGVVALNGRYQED